MKKTKKSKACQSKMQMVHNPFSELTSEEGDKHSLELRLARTEKYHSHLSKIIEVIHSVDVLHLFSILTLHTLFSTINNKNEISQLKCNVDQTHIELLQAIALKFTESELGIQFPDSDTVSTMIDILPEFSQSYSEMNSEIIQSDEQITPELIVQELIKLNTQHIRN